MKFLLGFILLTYIISVGAAIKAKKYDCLPADFTFIIVWTGVLIRDLLPQGKYLTFPYYWVPIAIVSSFVTARIYYKRNNKFYFWLFTVLGVVFSIAIILTAIGIIPNK